MRPIQIDGKTGEGGGQLVRMAIALAAVTGQAVTITNIRANRAHNKGGGLGNQHVTAIRFLAEATNAEVEGLYQCSKTVTFTPRQSPTSFTPRQVKIVADSTAASALLILQAALPFLVFAANDAGEPIELELTGGTNTSFSPSYDYFEQLVVPALRDFFGLTLECDISKRGWSLGRFTDGAMSVKIHPVPKGQSIKCQKLKKYTYPSSHELKSVDVTILTPCYSHKKLQNRIAEDLGVLFPDVEINFKRTEDSGQDARWYVLLVGHSVDGLRSGRDSLYSLPKAAKSIDTFIAQTSSKVCKRLYEEIEKGGHVDEFLQDQMVCFQALAEGLSSFPRGESPEDTAICEPFVGEDGTINVENARKEKTADPFGQGSEHTRTARWVASELLPKAKFYTKGSIVKGVAYTAS